MITIWITITDPEWGKIDASGQQILPFHYAFPHKLDRHLGGSRFRVWPELLGDLQAKAKSLGLEVEVLS